VRFFAQDHTKLMSVHIFDPGIGSADFDELWCCGGEPRLELSGIIVLVLIGQITTPTLHEVSDDSSVGIALGYGLDDRGSRIRFPAGAGNFSLHHRVQNGSGAHTASYPMGTRGSFPGDKAAGA
jgi:hypothetical protein